MDGLKVQSDCSKKDLDARWIKKNDINHYVYKNSICIDAEQSFIRCFVVTPANIHDSQMFPMLLNPENQDDYLWENSAYSGEHFKIYLAWLDLKIGSMRRVQEITL